MPKINFSLAAWGRCGSFAVKTLRAQHWDTLSLDKVSLKSNNFLIFPAFPTLCWALPVVSLAGWLWHSSLLCSISSYTVSAGLVFSFTPHLGSNMPAVVSMGPTERCSVSFPCLIPQSAMTLNKSLFLFAGVGWQRGTHTLLPFDLPGGTTSFAQFQISRGSFPPKSIFENKHNLVIRASLFWKAVIP